MHRPSFFLSLLLAASLPACGGGGGSAPHALPLLPPGTHAGIAFAEPDPGAREVLETAFGECIQAGLTAHPLSLSWSAMEREPGVVDTAQLVAWLDVVRAVGLVPYLVIPTIDTNNLNLPSDLVDPDDPRALAPGLAFDHPEVVARFSRLLDAVVPLLLARGGFFLSVGNEVDIYLLERGGADAFVRFAEAARDHVRVLAPDLGVGVTVTAAGLRRLPRAVERLVALGDAAAFTHYLLEEGRVPDPATVAATLDAMLAVAGERPVLLQEAGCPAGAEPVSLLGASAARQEAYVRALFEGIATRPRIRFVSFFMLADFRDATVDELLDYYGIHDAGFREFLATLGLRRADGAPRPAYAAFLEAVRALSARRPFTTLGRSSKGNRSNPWGDR